MNVSEPWNSKLRHKCHLVFFFFSPFFFQPSVCMCNIPCVCVLLEKHAGSPLKARLIQETCYTGCHCLYHSACIPLFLQQWPLAPDRIWNPVANSNKEAKCHTVFYVSWNIKITWDTLTSAHLFFSVIRLLEWLWVRMSIHMHVSRSCWQGSYESKLWFTHSGCVCLCVLH